MAHPIVTVDSLIANEFAVEINGARVGGVLRVERLITFATDNAGNRIKPTFEIQKMVERDASNAFNTWLRETRANNNPEARPRRDLTIVAIDDGIETRRWTAKNAWIQQVHYTAFDSASFEMVAEILTIAYDEIEESWPASNS